jgi:hypothetical protein
MIAAWSRASTSSVMFCDRPKISNLPDGSFRPDVNCASVWRHVPSGLRRRRCSVAVPPCSGQALAHLPVLLDVVLVKILDDVVQPIDLQRLAAPHQRVREMECLDRPGL